jgi:hypothetical protein
MRFVCFGYINETDWENLSGQDQQEILLDYLNFYQQLKENYKFLGGTGMHQLSVRMLQK